MTTRTYLLPCFREGLVRTYFDTKLETLENYGTANDGTANDDTRKWLYQSIVIRLRRHNVV